MSSDDFLTYRVALALYPRLDFHFFEMISSGSLGLEDFFNRSDRELQDFQELGADLSLRSEILDRAVAEIRFMKQHGIRCVLCTDPEYPFRMRGKQGAPSALFVLGDADLNSPHSVSYVGTRNATPYGLNFCRQSIADIASKSFHTLIVSGLAFGIDAASHLAAMENNLPTAAVVAHGLDTIYPAQHRSLARSILKHGGAIVSEYPSSTAPLRPRFLERNRIIGGMTDLTVVVESDVRGGAISTARHARNFGNNVAALPGRYTDKYSSGCNHLIAEKKGLPITHVFSVSEMLGLRSREKDNGDKEQSSLLPEMTAEQKSIYMRLKESESPMTPDQILVGLRMSVPVLLATLNEMAFDGLLLRHPGNRYSPAL